MDLRSSLLSGLLLAVEVTGYMPIKGQHLIPFAGRNDFTPVIFEGMEDAKLFARQQCSGELCLDYKCCIPPNYCTPGGCCAEGTTAIPACGCYNPLSQACCPISTYSASFDRTTTQTMTQISPPPGFSSADFNCSPYLVFNALSQTLSLGTDCLLSYAASYAGTQIFPDSYLWSTVSTTSCTTTSLPTDTLSWGLSTYLIVETSSGLTESFSCFATTFTDDHGNQLSLNPACLLGVSLATATSAPSTQTSTAASAGASTAASTATSTAASTVTNTETSTATSTGASAASSTKLSTVIITEASTVVNTEASTKISTVVNTASSTEASTVPSTVATTEASTTASTVASTATGVASSTAGSPAPISTSNAVPTIVAEARVLWFLLFFSTAGYLV